MTYERTTLSMGVDAHLKFYVRNIPSKRKSPQHSLQIQVVNAMRVRTSSNSTRRSYAGAFSYIKFSKSCKRYLFLNVVDFFSKRGDFCSNEALERHRSKAGLVVEREIEYFR